MSIFFIKLDSSTESILRKIQQAPTAGKVISKLIRLDRYETLDVNHLIYERGINGKLLIEDEV